MVLLENITAGERRLGVVFRTQLLDAHAGVAPFDFFLENINPQVIAATDPPADLVDENFDKLRARRPAADLVAQLVGQHVAHQRLVRIGTIEHPIGVLGQAEERDIARVFRRIHGRQGIGTLGITERRPPTKVEQTAAVEVRDAQKRSAPCLGVNEAHRDRDSLFLGNLFAEGVEQDEGQVGIKVEDVGFEQHVGLRGHGAG